jgi:hypothetical protein
MFAVTGITGKVGAGVARSADRHDFCSRRGHAEFIFRYSKV